MVLWFFFVFFKNCFRLPEDMYSVMKITCGQRRKGHDLEDVFKFFFLKKRTLCENGSPTLARFSFTSAQYLWNFTMFKCSNWMRLSKTAFTFS